MIDYKEPKHTTYNREEAIKVLKEQYGYQSYGEKHNENIFTAWFQAFYLPVKFGIDKRKAHFSSLINSGQMTREEALRDIAYAPVYPELGFEKKALSYPKRSHTDYKNSEWIRKTLEKIYAYLK